MIRPSVYGRFVSSSGARHAQRRSCRNKGRRFIVEYQCAQQPHGVAAYVASEGDVVNPFDWLACEAAASRKVACQFTAEK
ncbi:MAG: hypothetical protein ACJ8R9_27420 [Steroidobacteraceae bacterium]